MAVTGLAKKLQIKPGHRLVVLNAPDHYLASLEPLPAEVEVAEQAEGTFDMVHLFVRNSTELDKWIPTALAAVKPGGLLWISYPKGGAKAQTDLNRDILWKLMEPTGFRPVAQVAVDERWSAMRFRPVESVGAS